MVNLIRHFRKSPLGSILHIQVVPISVLNRSTISNNLLLQIFRNLKSNHLVWDTVISDLKQPTIWPINDQLDHQLTISGKMMIHPFKIVLLSFMIRLMALNDHSNVLRLKIVTSEQDLFCWLTLSNWIRVHRFEDEYFCVSGLLCNTALILRGFQVQGKEVQPRIILCSEMVNHTSYIRFSFSQMKMWKYSSRNISVARV